MYSGKESSPLGLGFAAEPFPLGTIQEGRDKTNWIVAAKNGIKVWSRITRLSEIKDRGKENADDDGEAPPSVKQKPAARKKAAVPPGEASQETNTPTGEGDDVPSQPASPTKRKPTNYNIYMKYKLKQLVKEETNLKPKERIAHAVALWQSMTLDEKNTIVAEAKEALEKETI